MKQKISCPACKGFGHQAGTGIICDGCIGEGKVDNPDYKQLVKLMRELKRANDYAEQENYEAAWRHIRGCLKEIAMAMGVAPRLPETPVTSDHRSEARTEEPAFYSIPTVHDETVPLTRPSKPS